MIFYYGREAYPEYLKHGNACQFIQPVAQHFCKGLGLDIGAGKWPLQGAIPVELKDGGDAMDLPPGPFDFIFSSHCLEHLSDPIAALEHWRTRLTEGGVLFLYLPHPDMEYWRPENCKKHRHSWTPERMVQIFKALGFNNILHSERDMAWSFCVVATYPGIKA